MENFNVSKYFRDQLFEQEDQLEPKDDDVDSAFTKEPEQEPEQGEEEDDGITLKMNQLTNFVTLAQNELAKNIKQGMSTLNPEVINKKWLLDSIKIGANDRGLADDLMEEVTQYNVKSIEGGNLNLIFLPLVRRILDTYFFKYFYPNTKELKPNQIANILDNMESILEDRDDYASGLVRFYENNFKYTKEGRYDDFEFDDIAATIKRKN